jgi:hypothetical protein
LGENESYSDLQKIYFSHRQLPVEIILRIKEFLSWLQKIMLIWGEEDKLFDIELARKMKE